MTKTPLLLPLVLLAGCAGDDAADEPFGAPAVAPIVREATPEGLRAPAAKPGAFASDMSTPIAALTALFQDDFVKLSGGDAPGLINAAVEDLDTRMAEADEMSTGADCLAAAAQDHRIDASGVAPALDLTLHVQCIETFDDGASGIVFGRDADDVSLWLNLRSMDGQGEFGYFANVLDASSDDRLVDFLYLEHSPQTFDRVQAYRVRAQPSTNAFEVALASSDSGGTTLSCGFQMISDGAHVYATGRHKALGESCADAAEFSICLDAADLTEQDATDCDTLAGTFTMDLFTAEDLADAGATFDALLPIGTSPL